MDLYDPDRGREIVYLGLPRSWDSFQGALAASDRCHSNGEMARIPDPDRNGYIADPGRANSGGAREISSCEVAPVRSGGAAFGARGSADDLRQTGAHLLQTRTARYSGLA